MATGECLNVDQPVIWKLSLQLNSLLNIVVRYNDHITNEDATYQTMKTMKTLTLVMQR